MRKKQHVVPTGDKWGIKGKGNSKQTSIFDRQSDAIAVARQFPKISIPSYLFTVVMDKFRDSERG